MLRCLENGQVEVFVNLPDVVLTTLPDVVFKYGGVNCAYAEAMASASITAPDCNKKGLPLHTMISNWRERQLQ